MTLPSGPFTTIVADPPWCYRDKVNAALVRRVAAIGYGADRIRGRRGAEGYYPVMSLDDIAALPVASVAAPNAHLYLWTTNAFIEPAHGIARAWGFEPRTVLTWVKMTPKPPGVEHWKPHPRHSTYEVSDHGEVRRNGRTLTKRLYGPYPTVRLYEDGAPLDARIHALVTETWLGPRPEGYDVDHHDGDKTNCCLPNLEYVTRTENLRRAAEMGVMGRSAIGVSHTAQWRHQIGAGHYFRNNTEHIVFAVRGRLSLLNRRTPTAFTAPRTRLHSEKPARFYEIVEAASPAPYLELFARRQRDGWTAWGDELDDQRRVGAGSSSI